MRQSKLLFNGTVQELRAAHPASDQSLESLYLHLMDVGPDGSPLPMPASPAPEGEPLPQGER
jgi:hypothetical protein